MAENQEIEEECELDERVLKHLMDMAHNKSWEYSVKEVIESLEDEGCEHVGKIVEDALYDNVFSVSTVDDDGSVWMVLGLEGEILWDKYNKGREGYSED